MDTGLGLRVDGSGGASGEASGWHKYGQVDAAASATASASCVVNYRALCVMAAVAVIAAAGLRTAPAAASDTAGAAMTASPAVNYAASVNTAANAGLAADSIRYTFGDTSQPAIATMTANAAARYQGAAAGTAGATAAGSAIRTAQASVSDAAGCVMSGGALVKYVATVSDTAGATMTAPGDRKAFGAVSDTAGATMTATADVISAVIDCDLTAAMPSGFTYTRSTIKYIVDATGALSQQAIDALAVSYDPITLAAKGRLFEQGRINYLRNNTMVGAATGTPGTRPTNWAAFSVTTGLTLVTNAVTTSSNVELIEIQLSGTPTSSSSTIIPFEAATQIAGASGDNWAISAFLQMTAGSMVGLTGVNLRATERDSGGTALVTQQLNVTPSSAANIAGCRMGGTVGLTQATTAFVQPALAFGVTSGVAVNITLRIGLPQFEKGVGYTSPIKTLGSASVSRSGDSLMLSTLPVGFDQTKGTLYAEWELQAGATPSSNVCDVGDGVSSNIRLGRYNSAGSSNDFAGLVSGTSSFSIGSSNQQSAGVKYKAVGAYQVGSQYRANSDGTNGSTTSSTLPTSDRFAIGRRAAGSEQLNGFISRVRYYPTKLPNNVCNAMVA